MQTKLHHYGRSKLLLMAVVALVCACGVVGSSFAIAAPGPLVYSPTNSVAAALPTSTCTLVATTRTCELWATTGTIALPGVASVPIWGYSITSTVGSAQLPGPILVANQGETLKIILHNALPGGQSNSLSLPDLDIAPDMVGVTSGNAKTYTLSLTQPGTFLYEAGLTPDGARQVAMGLYGGLIVRPSGAPTGVYDASTTFDDEALLIFSEIDPAFNAAPSNLQLNKFNAKYWLINGKSYPNTSSIPTGAGHKVLLRYLNAGTQHHSIGTLGLHQTVLGQQGFPLAHPYQIVAETLAAGQGLDLLTTIPSASVVGTKLAIYNGARHVDNAGALSGGTNGTVLFGGMLTFLSVDTGAATGPTGPLTTNVAVTPTPTNGSVNLTLSAKISVTNTTGGNQVTDAEYYIDSGAPVAFGSFGAAPTVNVSTSIPSASLAGLSAGNHMIYVRGKDTAGNWSQVASTTLNLDKAGPTSSGQLKISSSTFSTTNGTSDVIFQGTADDSASGSADIADAEYYIDGGAHLPLTGSFNAVTPVPGPVSDLNGTIASTTVAALSEGPHTVYVRSKDSLGNWGTPATFSLNVDKTGPTMNANSISVSPNPNNGTLSFDPNAPFGSGYVKMVGTASDPVSGTIQSNIVKIEGFLDTIGANGSGFVFSPTDGNFNSASEAGLAQIPLANLTTAAQGPHTLYAHAQDAAGNWGPTGTTILIVDKTGPAVTGASATITPTVGAFTAVLAATATDPANGAAAGSNIVAAEWFDGTDPNTPLHYPFVATDGSFNSNSEGIKASADLSSLTAGNHTLSIRAKDAAGNWGPTTPVSVTVPARIFANGFETGNFNNWSATTGTNISVTGPSALVGTQGMQVAITGNTPGYVTDNTPANEATYNARFYFNPNGTSTNASGIADIFQALNTGGTTPIIRVQYQRLGTTYQVRAVVSRNGGNSSTSWYPITNASHAIEIGWRSGASTSFSLYIDGTLKQTLTGLNTSAYKVDVARLGAISGLASGMSGTMYFDGFISTKGTYIGL